MFQLNCFIVLNCYFDVVVSGELDDIRVNLRSSQDSYIE